MSGPSVYSRYASGPKTLFLCLSLKVSSLPDGATAYFGLNRSVRRLRHAPFSDHAGPSGTGTAALRQTVCPGVRRLCTTAGGPCGDAPAAAADARKEPAGPTLREEATQGFRRVARGGRRCRRGTRRSNGFRGWLPGRRPLRGRAWGCDGWGASGRQTTPCLFPKRAGTDLRRGR
jgi:hypothetical protein